MALIYPQQIETMHIDLMQETHENEIELLNRIEKLYNRYRKDKNDTDELNQAVDAYVKHVKEHFSNEEELMQRYNFPEYEMHKLAHDAFLADLSLT